MGGTWTSAALCDELGARRVRHPHDPLASLTKTERAGRRSFGTVRPALEWYAAHWCYVMDSAQREHLRVWGSGETSFREVLYGMTHPHTVQPPDRRPGSVFQTRERASVAIQTCGAGLWSWMLWYFYGPSRTLDVDALIHTKRLTEGLTALTGVGMAHRAPVNRQADRGEPVDYRALYDEQMVGWVLEADAEMRALLGFTEPWGDGGWTVGTREGTSWAFA